VTSDLQLTLNNPEEFRPVPAGTRHYVAALQTKPGELSALRHARPETRTHITPLVEVLGPRSAGTEPYTNKRVDGWVKKVANTVGPIPIFLDRIRLAPNHRTATPQGNKPVLSAIYGSARARGISFVPVLRLNDLPATLSQIGDAALSDGRGVALRIPLLGTLSADGRDTQTLIKEALDIVQVDIPGADLLLDLHEINDESEIDVDFLAPMIDDLVTIGSWRSVVLLGTTMPRSLGGGIVVAGTVGRLPRKEWLIWSALRSSQIARLPTYGDYAIQHPDPPLDTTEGQLPLGMRGAIRYTHEAVTVIPRAKAPRHEEGREQYRQLCQVLVQQPEFAGRDFTWGDQQIADCAEGTTDPGWEDHWRGVGTSHHFRYVVDQLASIS
jgi:hypothetical protein